MSWLLPLLVALPAAGALVLALWRRPSADRLAAVIGVGTASAALAVSVLAAVVSWGRDGMRLESAAAWIPSLDIWWRVGIDGISLPLVLLTTLLSLLCMVALLWERPERARALVLSLLLLETGVLGTFVALDLVLFFIFFEAVLIPMWFVIADWGDPHDRAGRRRAATVFLLLTVIGSAVMLVGFLLVHAHTGTFDMVRLAERGGQAMSTPVQVLAAAAIGLGLAVKAPMWPLHIWLPDAHAKAPTVGSVLLAGVLLKMGTYGFVRIWVPAVPEGAEVLAPYLAALAAVGIVYGSLACLAQTDLKRLVAYSSVGHMGFVLLGIATLTPVGVNGALVANIAHGLITGLLFFLAGALKDRNGSAELAVIGRGLYSRSPRLAAVLAITAMASLGLPGLAGFWGEMLTLLGAFDPADGLPRAVFLVCMVAGGVGAVLTAAYFLHVVRRLCQGEPEAAPAEASSRELATWAPLLVLTVVLGLAPGLLLAITDPAVQFLLGSGR